MHYDFRKRENVAINLHVYKESYPEIELNLSFRDYLKAHPKIREDYARLKANLLQNKLSFQKENSVFTNYTLRKGGFIRSVLKKSGFSRIRTLKCNDEIEWKTVKYFRDKYFFDSYGTNDPYTWTFNHSSYPHLVLYEAYKIIGYEHNQFWSEFRAPICIITIDEKIKDNNAGDKFFDLIEQ